MSNRFLAYVMAPVLSLTSAMQSAAAPIQPDGFDFQQHSQNQSYGGRVVGAQIPDIFNKLGLPVVKNDVSQTMAQNYMDYIASHDPNFENITSEDFNTPEIPASEARLKLYAQAYYEEFFALIFQEGSEIYKLADGYLNGSDASDAVVRRIIALAAESPVMKDVNDLGTVNEYLMLEYGNVGLDPNKVIGFIDSNLSGFNKYFTAAFIENGLKGPVLGCEGNDAAVNKIHKLFQLYFEYVETDLDVDAPGVQDSCSRFDGPASP